MKALMALLLLPLVGCTGVGKLEVQSDENAVGCFEAEADTSATVVKGASQGRTVDVGKTDTSSWTAKDWGELIKVCFDG